MKPSKSDQPDLQPHVQAQPEPDPVPPPQALVVHQPMEVAAPTLLNTAGVAAMLKAVIDQGINGESVKAVEAMVSLFERVEKRDAEKEFIRAFVELMKEVPAIQATKPVPNDDGTTRYEYAPFEEIDEKLRPLAMKHGFTYTFSEGQADSARVCKVCTVQHIGGHTKANSYTVRIGQGPPKTSDSQKDGSAHTYAKRGALCDAFNIVVYGQDNDARIEGGKITAEQARELEERVKNTASDRAAFLKYAGAKDFAEIAAAKYAMLDASLKRKEKTS